jgi:hypothetical protein
LLESGLIDNIEQWSERTGTIIHSWGKRQRFNTTTGGWFGDCLLCLFSGKNRMFFSYNESKQRFDIKKTDFDDPSTIFSFISELCDIFDLKMSMFQNMVERGRWIIDEKTKTTVFSGHDLGIKILRTNSNSYDDYGDVSIQLDENFTNLVNYTGKKIMSVKTGLLSCSGPPTFEFKDFKVDGVSLINMAKIGVMTNGFDFQYKSRSEILNVLEDINVERPESITYMTKQKLNLKSDWSIREQDSKDDLEMEINEDETRQKLEANKLNVMQRFMDFDESELKEEGTFSNLIEMGNFVDDFMTTDFFVGTSTTSTLSFPKKIMKNVLTFKALAVCHQLLPSMRINKNSFSLIKTITTEKKNIFHALLTYYDQLYHTDAESPGGVFIDISDDFLQKFYLQTIDLSEFLD